MVKRAALRLGLGLLSGLMPGLLGTAQADAELSGRTLREQQGNQVVWQRTFPAEQGNLSAPLSFAGRTYIGIGPSVYAFGAAGEVLGRADLPAPSSSLDSAAGAVRVSTQGDGYTELFTLGEPTRNLNLPLQERAVFPPLPAVTEWLARGADAVPAAQLSQAATADPSNPFLALREAIQQNKAGDSYRALQLIRQALGGSLTFASWTQLAARLDTAGYPGAADLALEHARKDAAARGLDPDIPINRAALAAYGNPSGYVGTLLAQNRLGRAGVWMNFLRQVYPGFEGHSALYSRYAALLETQGRVGEAEEWRAFDRSLREGSLYNLGPDDTGVVRDAARLATLALLLSLVAAYLTLSSRAWKQQQQDTQPFGGRWRSLWKHPLTRARLGLLSYAALSERLTLVLLALGLLLALGGWQWADQTGQGLRASALNIGTYGGGWYNAQLDDLNLRPGPDNALLSGLAAQLDGDDTVAREAYTQAGQDACTINNLGVIAHDREDTPQALERYREALTLRPDLGAAAYNLGLSQPGPGAIFQRAYRPNQPRLCYPDRRNLARVVGSNLGVTLRENLTNPLAFLQARDTLAQSWRLSTALLMALALLGWLGFMLLVPRLSSERMLGRPALYRLLSLLLPGAGLISNPWGGVLLLTWAACVTGLLPLLMPAGGLLHFPLLPDPHLPTIKNLLLLGLVLSYGVNILALSLAEARYLRRLRHP